MSGPAERHPARRQAVRRLKAQGVDFIKLLSLIPRDAVFAIADESKRQGITFVGHAPDAVRASEASNAGRNFVDP